MSPSQWDPFAGRVNRLQAKTRASGSGRLTEKMMKEVLARSSRPRKVGPGEAVMAAVTATEQQPFKWDTNGFYRRLGVDPYCDRVEIAHAFNDLNPNDPRFSWYATAARVLLKKPLRALYDRLSLGSFWSDDPDLIEFAIEGMVRGDFLDGSIDWTVYADADITDEQAGLIDPAWRPALIEAIDRHTRWARSPYTFYVALGVTRSLEDVRWETIGYTPVFFVPIDGTVDRRYVEHAAETLVRYSVPTEVLE